MEEHKIKVIADTGKSVEDLNKLEAALNDVEAELIPLTTQMGEMEDQLMLMAHAGDTSSEKFMQLSTQVAGMRKTVRETDMQIEALSMTTGQKLGGALTGITGAFEMAQGVMGAFGAQGEEVEAALLKVQSAMAIAQGVQTIKESANSFKALGMTLGIVSKAKEVDTAITAAQTAVTVTGAAATGGMTIAQRALNLVMKANPVFLIIGGITALVGAFALFSSSADDAADSQKRLNDRLKESEEYISLFTKMADSNRHDLELMKIRGASERDLYNQKLTLLKSEKTARDVAASEEGYNLNRLRIQRNAQLKIEEDERKRIAKEEAEALKAFQDDVLKNQQQMNVDKVNAEIQESLDEKERKRQSLEDISAMVDALDAEDLIKAKANSDAKILLAQKEAEAKQALFAKTSETLTKGADLLGKNTAAGKSMAVAAALINTYQGITAELATKTVTPFEIGLKIANVGIIAATGFKAVKNILAVKTPGGGGSGGGGSMGSISTPATVAPNVNVVGASRTNAIAETIAQQGQQPIKAYVVANDVTTQQGLNRSIVTSASIG